MSERTGICLDCGQRYGDIPDSVTATRIRCQVCQGTVEIPPLAAPPTPEASPAPASDALGAKPLGEAPKKVERPAAAAPVDREVAKPAKKAKAPVKPVAKAPAKPAGKTVAKPVFTPRGAKPSKPVVQPKAPIKPVAKPAPLKPAAKPAPVKPAPVKPVAKAAPPKPVAKPVAKAPVAKPAAAAPANDDAAKKAKAAAIIAKAKAKRDAQAGGQKPKASGSDVLAQLKAKKEVKQSKPVKAAGPVPRKKPAKTSGGAGHKSTQAAGTRSRRERDDEGGSHHRHHTPPKSGPPMALMIISIVGLGAMAGGWYWWQGQEDDQVDTTTSTQAPENAGNTGTADPIKFEQAEKLDDLPAADSNAGTDDDASDPGATSEDNAAKPDDGAKPEEASAPKPAPSKGASFIPPGPGEGADSRGITDFDELDLKLVPSIPKWSECSDEEWASIKEDLETFLDDQGAFSNRAGDRIAVQGRKAYPAVVNALLQQDFGSKAGTYVGTTLNDLLYKICNSKPNFGWNNVDQLEEGSDDFLAKALLNKKIAAAWHRYWFIQDFSTNDSSWNKFCGLDDKGNDAAEEIDAGEDFFDD
jgi:hypothetical protein